MFTTYDLQQFLEGVFTLFTWVYWGTMLLMLAILVPMVFKKGKSQSRKILNAIGTSAGIILLFVQIIPMLLIMAFAPSKAEQQTAEAWQRKYQAAEAVFKQQCEKAGEKIYRTVENVEGIMLLKVMKDDGISIDAKHHDPMWDDAVLRSYSDKGFIEMFLGMTVVSDDEYTYVDVLQKNQKDIIRYTDIHNKRPIIENFNPKNPARYAVTFEHNIDPELRKHWVAGVTIQIIDRKNNEFIAEKVIYAFEKGLGSKGGGRMPWAFAITCENKDTSRSILPKFVNQVLKPRNVKQETPNVQ
ncbi:hypothetical protein [Alysiella crassa]|uniref:hypothetical protein n=1 Tax=Alysiella crassa TaxID=153491 RepID=UPI001FD57D0B|nr:hypothetical protein [Alysiella crassa]UOP06641.1 hypothetical protein LVJ80_13030 [Alysiella crassa]